MKRIFITGISGYIASLLARTLLERDPGITSSQKLIQETGFSFRYDTRQAFMDFARHVTTAKGGTS